MTENNHNHNHDGPERRSESRSSADQYSSVEFSMPDLMYLYQFKVWDTSPSGLSILIKEGSDILQHLKVGDTLDIKYYPNDSSEKPEIRKTEIVHITKGDDERVKGHYSVGLAVK